MLIVMMKKMEATLPMKLSILLLHMLIMVITSATMKMRLEQLSLDKR